MFKATLGGQTLRLVGVLVLLGTSCSDPGTEPQEPGPASGGTGSCPDEPWHEPEPEPEPLPQPDPGQPSTPQGPGSGSTPNTPHPQLPDDQSPNIEIWYGAEQTHGDADSGAPQRWLNVLGRILDPTLSSLTYSVNCGPPLPFAVGPTTTRLMDNGDFNLELDRDSLSPLPQFNVVEIRGEAPDGEIHSRYVSLGVPPENQPSPQVFVDWAELDDWQDLHRVASVVDGLWHLTDDGIRTSAYGYDRLIALGSRHWSGNYEVLATFTVHHWRNWGAVGLAAGWQGHEGETEPREDWPLEALGWVRKVVPQPELQIMTFRHGVLARRDFDLTTQVRYQLRLRTRRTEDLSEASLSIWPENQQEPAEWLLTASAPQHDGSVLLIAHHADVTWHSVQVMPLP